MSVALAVVGLPVVLVLPGLVTLSAFAPLRRLDWLERIYLVLAISLVLSGWVGVVLAQSGIFSAGLLVGLLALYTVVLGYVAWRHGRLRWPRPEGASERTWVIVAFLAISLVFGLLAFRPFELILGPRDAATYPAMASQIARHGGIRILDEIVPTLLRPTADETHRVFVQFFGVQPPGRSYYHYTRMPSFFIADTEEGVWIPQFLPYSDGRVVVPQFYPLYPTWLATAFGLVGVKAGLQMTPYLSLLGGVGVFLLARRLLGARVALLAYLLLGLQTLQVWFARYSTAEGATQFLFFLGLLAVARLEEDDESRREPFWGLLAGAAIGMIGLVRVEFFFPWLLLLPYLLYLYISRRVDRSHRAMLLVGGVLVVHTVLLFVTHTRGYTLSTYYHRIQDWATITWVVVPFSTPLLRWYLYASPTPRTQVLHQPWRLAAELGVLLLLVVVVIVLRRSPRLTARIGQWLRRRGRLLLGFAAGLFLVVFFYLYVIRPGILTPSVLLHPLQNWLTLQGYVGAPVPVGEAANMVRLGWYLSPLGMLLAAAGVAGLLLRESTRRSWFLFLLGLFYLIFFNYDTFGVAHHIYIMRRYVAMVVPFLSIAMAYAICWLGGLGRRNQRAVAGEQRAGSRTDTAPGRAPEASPLLGRGERRRKGLRWAARVVAALLAAAMVLYLIYTGLPFYRHQEYRGALEQVGSLAAKFGPDDVILLIDDARDAPFTIATPLRYLFDRNALVIMPTGDPPPDVALIEEQIERWWAEGRRVVLLVGNDGGRLLLPHMRLRWLERFELSVSEFEALFTQKPHNAYDLHQPFALYVPEPWSGPGSPLGELPLEVDLGSGGYVNQVAGFYSDETDPSGTTYCWTQGQAVLRVPWPVEGLVTVTLRMAGSKRPAEIGPAEVEVWGEQYLFGVGPDLAAGLDRGEVSATLRVQFQTYGRELTPQALVEVKQAGRDWAIVDAGARYSIRSADQTLSVYLEQVLGSWELETGFTTHSVAVPAGAVTVDGNGTVLLHIVSPTWKQADYGLGSDTRPLGVEVDWVRVGSGER